MTATGGPDTDLRTALTAIIPSARVRTSVLDRIAFASDASFYRLIPRAVVQPASIEEVRELFAFARGRGMPLTFRAAGTSLSGQAITDGLLVDVSRFWRRFTVLDNGRSVRVEPGVVGGAVNRSLRQFGRRMGPDPASINACMMGGILANNSSGMCCGVRHNAYHTLQSMTFVLPDGGVWDTERDTRAFRATKVSAELCALRDRVRSDADLVALIRRKYEIKNTSGYSLNAFLDHDDPLAMLARLMIGSEGTLGFIAEAVLQTVEDPPLRLTGLFIFRNVGDACDAIAPLSGAGAAALELMDRASLTAVAHQPGIPAVVKGLPEGATALLVEVQAKEEDQLADHAERIHRIGKKLRLIGTPLMAADEQEREALWRIRKGLYPSVGAVRESGTTVIIEDFAVPVGQLRTAVTRLQALFLRHGYPRGIVFGHARHGNLHFVITQSFNNERAIAQYAAFIEDVVDMIAAHGGSLKAEHGTGRNMAPFVEREWGAAAFVLMRELKRLVDPTGFLNPGVIVTDDALAHVHHLKDCPAVAPEVDKCIECGFCERHCPSRDLTMTPRQRIVAMREVARGGPLGAAVWREYSYPGMETCAADGMCATACPVSIDTGRLIKRLRSGGLDVLDRRSTEADARSTQTPWTRDFQPRRSGALLRELARFAARRYGWLERFARLALRMGHFARGILGTRFLNGALRLLERVFRIRLPKWLDPMPLPARPVVSRVLTCPAEFLEKKGGTPPCDPRGPTKSPIPPPNLHHLLIPSLGGTADFIYFPSCVSRIMGPTNRGEASVSELLIGLASRAGIAMRVPRRVEGTCCGMPFSSKGYPEAAQDIARRTHEWLREMSEDGALPVVVDNSSCALSLREHVNSLPASRSGSLHVIDAVEFVHDVLLPRLAVRRRTGPVAVHPVCSLVRMGLEGKLLALARACADSAEVLTGAGCCGMAGDRGLYYPELLGSATSAEAASLREGRFERFCASNRTCELGLSHATGQRCESFLALLDEATRA